MRRKDSADAPEEISLDANERAAGTRLLPRRRDGVSPDRNGWPFARTRSAGASSRCASRICGPARSAPRRSPTSRPTWRGPTTMDRALCREGSRDAARALRQEAPARARIPARRAGIRADRPELLHRRFQVQIGALHFHPHGKHACRPNGAMRDADDPSLRFKIFLPHEADHEYQIEHLGDDFIVRTNWQARNFRLMQAPIGARGDRARWGDLVAHRDDTFIEDFDVFERFLAVSVRSGGLRRSAFIRCDGARRILHRERRARVYHGARRSIRNSTPTSCATPIPR